MSYVDDLNNAAIGGSSGQSRMKEGRNKRY